MNISVELENGYLPDKYGKYAPEDHKKYGNAICSFPIHISDVPKGTQSLALIFFDYDSTPVCGFPWIHWIMYNIDPSTTFIPENASQNPLPQWRQGYNSTYSRLESINHDLTVAQAYVGPCPPDCDHTYTLRVYALDVIPELAEGFFLNQLHWSMQNHIIECAELNMMSRS